MVQGTGSAAGRDDGELAGRRVLVVGLARSGVAAARLLARRGARVVATDLRAAAELGAEVASLVNEGVRLELGGHDAASFAAAELVVVSPGVPRARPELEAARAAGVPVIGELELGYRCLRGQLAAVTGTKGKSTTTEALGAMLREAGGDVRVGGNIGRPLCGLVEGASEASRFVLEVSSFQLESCERFHAQVAVFLNLTPDHLDRHRDFAEYRDAKARVFRNQTPEDWAVVNADDPQVLELARRGAARLLPFHPRLDAAPPARGDAGWFEAGEARLRRGAGCETLFRLAELRLPGAHLAGDLLAAACAARLLGAAPAAIARAAAAYAGVEHVLEPVAEHAGVRFYNDSKATNVDALARSLEAFAGGILAILGGRYKGGDFASLRPLVAQRVKRLLLVGEARERIAAALGDAAPASACADLRAAVAAAWAAAAPGDVVLLAPGCSSFDMFRDYAERGRVFKQEVRRLIAELGGGTSDAPEVDDAGGARTGNGPPARSGAHPAGAAGFTPDAPEVDDAGGARTGNG